MDAVAAQTVQVGCDACDQCFTFTGLHFSDTALMEHDRADNLHRERLFAEDAVRSLTNSRQCFNHNIIERFAVRKTLAELNCLGFQFCIRESLIFLIQLKYFFLDRFDLRKLFFAVRAEDPVDKTHCITAFFKISGSSTDRQ